MPTELLLMVVDQVVAQAPSIRDVVSLRSTSKTLRDAMGTRLISEARDSALTLGRIAAFSTFTRRVQWNWQFHAERIRSLLGQADTPLPQLPAVLAQSPRFISELLSALERKTSPMSGGARHAVRPEIDAARQAFPGSLSRADEADNADILAKYAALNGPENLGRSRHSTDDFARGLGLIEGLLGQIARRRPAGRGTLRELLIGEQEADWRIESAIRQELEAMLGQLPDKQLVLDTLSWAGGLIAESGIKGLQDSSRIGTHRISRRR